MTLTSPDWGHWSQMGEIELWEFIALSCDIEPRVTSHHRLNQRGLNEYTNQRTSYDRERLLCERYQSRYDIARSSLGVDVIPLSGTGSDASLAMPDAKRWAAAKGWPVPPALHLMPEKPAAVQPATQTSAAQSEALHGNHDAVVPDTTDQLLEKPVSKDANDRKPKRTWNDHDLRRLLTESQEPAMNQQKLADQYGLSRQYIARLLTKAAGKFRRKKASAFDPLPGHGKK